MQVNYFCAKSVQFSMRFRILSDDGWKPHLTKLMLYCNNGKRAFRARGTYFSGFSQYLFYSENHHGIFKTHELCFKDSFRP